MNKQKKGIVKMKIKTKQIVKLAVVAILALGTIFTAVGCQNTNATKNNEQNNNNQLNNQTQTQESGSSSEQTGSGTEQGSHQEEEQVEYTEEQAYNAVVNAIQDRINEYCANNNIGTNANCKVEYITNNSEESIAGITYTNKKDKVYFTEFGLNNIVDFNKASEKTILELEDADITEKNTLECNYSGVAQHLLDNVLTSNLESQLGDFGADINSGFKVSSVLAENSTITGASRVDGVDCFTAKNTAVILLTNKNDNSKKIVRVSNKLYTPYSTLSGNHIIEAAQTGDERVSVKALYYTQINSDMLQKYLACKAKYGTAVKVTNTSSASTSIGIKVGETSYSYNQTTGGLEML